MSTAVDFDVFWREYPVRVGKLKARAAWKKLHPDLSVVLGALAWQKTSQQWRAGFIPHPTTYLNQGRWMDEPFTPPVTSSVCDICGHPEPRYHSQVECNQRWLAQNKSPVGRSQE